MKAALEHTSIGCNADAESSKDIPTVLEAFSTLAYLLLIKVRGMSEWPSRTDGTRASSSGPTEDDTWQCVDGCLITNINHRTQNYPL